jgi:predicted ribosome quality control (RQC) complex YloA/Tae2 family protein
MSLNWQEIDLVLSEWRLDGALIQNIAQPDYANLYMEFYQPGRIAWVQICLQAGLTRLHLIEAPARSKAAQPRFGEFLRARIKGGHVESVRQLGQERIIRFDIRKDDGLTSLYVRLWGNAANILAVDGSGCILDAFYRRPLKGEVSGEPLLLPPVREALAGDRDKFPIRQWSGENGGFNHFLAESYRRLSGEQEIRVLRERLSRQAEAAQVRLEGRNQSLRRQAEQNANPERFKQLGEMLLAYKQQIARGSGWFSTDDWYQPGVTIRIELDEKLDALANAERYFQKYQKARDGRRYLEEERRQVEVNLARVRELGSAIGQAADIPTLHSLADSLAVFVENTAGKKTGLDSPRPGLSFESHGFPVFIGRNVQENDELLRRHVRGNDWWLHVRDLPGGYVFIKVPKTKSVPLEVLLDAAHLAVWYSRAKHEPEVDLFYTQVKYLRRAKHGTYGMVIPTRERNLHVIVDPERTARLTGNLNLTD